MILLSLRLKFINWKKVKHKPNLILEIVQLWKYLYLEFGKEILIKKEMAVILFANNAYVKLGYLIIIILNIYLQFDLK